MVKLRSFQSALFVAVLNLENKLKLASDIISASKNILEGDPTILPIPPDAPPEIPRIITKSKDERYTCNVSLNRIDLFSKPKGRDEQSLDVVSGEYLKLLLNLTSLLKENFKIAIPRIGIVANLLLELSESSNTYVLRKYIKESSLISETHEAQIHALNKITLSNKIKVNRRLRIITSRSAEDPSNDKYLSISIDINSVPEVPYDFDRELIQLTFNAAVDHMKNLIKQHYGEL